MKTETQKETQKEFIGWVLHQNKNQFFSYRTMRQIFGSKKYEKTISTLLENNDLKLIRASKVFEVEGLGGSRIVLRTKAKYATKSKVTNINDNPYYQKLMLLLENNKVSSKDSLIISQIKKTIAVSTIDGKAIDMEYFKKKTHRYYSDYVGLPKETRKKIKIDGKKTISIDLKSSVIQLLSKSKLNGSFDNQLYFDYLYNPDFWLFQSKKLGLTREETKELWVSSIFGFKQDSRLETLYPIFFQNIKNIKIKFGYKFVSKIYFALEEEIMTEIMTELAINNKYFLPVHDCIIVQENEYGFVSDIFKNYKLKFSIEY